MGLLTKRYLNFKQGVIGLTVIGAILLSVTVTVLPYESWEEINANFRASPSGKKQVVVYANTSSPAAMWAKVVLRTFRDDGSYTDAVICGGDEPVPVELEDGATRERRLGSIDYVIQAWRFTWVDEDHLIFNLWWREGGKPRKAVVLYDGKGIRELDARLGSNDCWLVDGRQMVVPMRSAYGDEKFAPWLIGEIGEDGMLKNLRELPELASTRDVYNFGEGGKLSHGKVYFTRRIDCADQTRKSKAENEVLQNGGPDVVERLLKIPPAHPCKEAGLWSYDLKTGEFKQLCKHAGVIEAKSRQGYIIYCGGRTSCIDELAGYYPDRPDLVVVDTTGEVYSWRIDEEFTEPDQQIAVYWPLFSYDGEQVLLFARSDTEEKTLWERYYVVEWRKGAGRQVKKPEVEGYSIRRPRYWGPDGVWWLAREEATGKHRILLIDGFEEVTE